eukprot:349925-Alexandrium_andersonii.AAC.1
MAASSLLLLGAKLHVQAAQLHACTSAARKGNFHPFCPPPPQLSPTPSPPVASERQRAPADVQESGGT